MLLCLNLALISTSMTLAAINLLIYFFFLVALCKFRKTAVSIYNSFHFPDYHYLSSPHFRQPYNIFAYAKVFKASSPLFCLVTIFGAAMINSGVFLLGGTRQGIGRKCRGSRDVYGRFFLIDHHNYKGTFVTLQLNVSSYFMYIRIYRRYMRDV